MMETEKLRKADIFSGAIVMLIGGLIIYNSMQMPMTDSYGGVQNVWYVSPALFPLFVGAMLFFLGGGLVKTGLKAVGLAGVRSVVTFLSGSECIAYLKEENSVRYYGIVFNLLIFVFVLVPHVDFFLAAIFFLLILFCMYYCGDHDFLIRMLKSEIVGSILFCAVLFSPLSKILATVVLFPCDWLMLLVTVLVGGYSGRQFAGHTEKFRRFKISLILALVAPFTLGIIFKYFLMVPMPFEGLVVTLLDSIWYAELWS